MLKRHKTKSGLSAVSYRFAVVCADYNQEFTRPLLAAAERELLAAGCRAKNILVARVPGSFDIPVVVQRLAATGKFDAIIALGVVLQGRTSHARHITQATAFHLQKIAIDTGVPVINQVLSPSSAADARKRTSGKNFNRGVEAARAAIRMASLMRKWGES